MAPCWIDDRDIQPVFTSCAQRTAGTLPALRPAAVTNATPFPQARPAMPERNQFRNLTKFMVAWDRPAALNCAPIAPTKSSCGSINSDGSIEGVAAIVTRHHPDFNAFIEDGVRDLVLALIDKLDCITYSSCAGHATADGKLICGRHIGVIPRDTSEYLRIRQILKDAIASTKVATPALSLQLNETTLCSDEITLPCIDILFSPLTGRATEYFNDADRVSALLLRVLGCK